MTRPPAGRVPVPEGGWKAARCRVFVEGAADVMFAVDQGGACTFLNRRIEAVTGRRISDLDGIHLTSIVVSEQREHVWRQCQRALNGEDIGAFEFEVPGPAPGGRRTLEVIFRPVLDEGVIVAVDAVARDVTSRNALEAATRHQQKMDAISRLAAGVAHDFNNLLGVILGQVEATAPLVAGHPELHPAVASIRAAAERAASLAGHLLVLSQRQVIQPRILDLNHIVTASLPLLERLVGDRVDVVLQLGEKIGAIRADASQIRQVVANLAIHAQAAMPGGGRITITTANVDVDEGSALARPVVAPGRYVVLSVTDTGIGIDPAALEWIFEPFFASDANPSAGLGLSTVHTIVRQSGGTIEVDSRRGIGTTFRLYLPRVEPPVTVAPAPEGPTHGTETILLVEDEADLRDILEQALRARGYGVIAAADGYACLALCRQLAAPPALLVTDVVIPGLGGRALAETLALDFPDMPVLFISGYTDDADLLEAVRRGAHFMQKPFGLQEFAARVRQILDAAQAGSPGAD